MDANERLRRYLEQRREAGETELVLDHFTRKQLLERIRDVSQAAPSAAAQTFTDWRAMLRSSPEGSGEPVGEDTLRPEPPPSPPKPRRDAAPSEPLVPPPALRSRADAIAPAPIAAIDIEKVPVGLAVGGSGRELFGVPEAQFSTLDDVARAVAACTRCPLHRTAKSPVPGEGNANADLVCVGEAPGAVEDETGRPFVGAAGQLLDKILNAIQLSRSDVFICNVLKHRPPGNRNPMPDEVQACSPYLVRQIEIINPKVIVAFGTFAAQTLLNTKEAIGKLRGKIHRYYGVPLVVTYHPAALLRNPGWKRPTWEDVQLARRLLDRAVSS